MAYSFLSDLTVNREDWMIQVRLCRMWQTVNPNRNGDLVSLDLLFIDEKKTLMHAAVDNEYATLYKEELTKGTVLDVKGFKVVQSTGNYRPVANPLKIIFLGTTMVNKKELDVDTIPLTGFDFIKPEMLTSRVHNNAVLSDVIGCLYSIGETENFGPTWKKKPIKVITDYSVKATINLWGDLGEKFAAYFYNNYNGSYIVIVTSTIVTKFRGEIWFSTTNSSKVYINLETDYTTTLREKFAHFGNDLEVTEIPQVNIIPIAEEVLLNRRSIEELLKCEWSDEMEEYTVTVRARITEIDSSFGWNYTSCPLCGKKVRAINSVYKCYHCDEECKDPLLWYKINIKVKDATGESTFVLLNYVAETLLGSPAQRLIHTPHSPINDVPVPVQNLCNQEFIFKLKLSSYNLKEGGEYYIVTKVFNPDGQV